MKTVQFVIGAATCIALSACTGLLPKQELQGCYPVNTLSARERVALNVENGNPIFLVGGEEIVCECYSSSSLAGAVEGDRLAGEDEGSRLAGEDEGSRLAGDFEGSRLDGAVEGDRLAGDAEGSSLAGDGEGSSLDGYGEGSHLAGDGERSRLAGDGEGSLLAGKFAEFSCRIVPKCSGFQLIGYEPKKIKVRTSAGQKYVPTNCVTW